MSDDELSKIVWDYMLLAEDLQPADVILGLGAHDHGIALRAAELYKAGLAPIILFSGGFGRITANTATQPEALVFKQVAIKAGVPQAAILTETESTNTAENIQFSAKLLKASSLPAGNIIVVQKPYMERRTLATIEAQWPQPQPKFTITSEQVSFDDYCTDRDKAQVISVMVGDLQRIREYPKLGYQSEQPMPDSVWQAGSELIKRGYNKHLIR